MLVCECTPYFLKFFSVVSDSVEKIGFEHLHLGKMILCEVKYVIIVSSFICQDIEYEMSKYELWRLAYA